MAKIDKIREEAINLRTLKFFILSVIIMLLAGFGSLYMKFIGSRNGLITIGMIIILFVLKLCGIIYYKYDKNYHDKLNELERIKEGE